MMGINKVTLIGNLGDTPEVKKTQTAQRTFTVFSLATSNSWTNRDGQKQEHTEWHRIVVWSKMAEVCGEYLSKGSKVYIEGRLQTRSWEDDKGQKRYTTEVVAQQVLFLNSVDRKKIPNPDPSIGESPYAKETSFGEPSSDVETSTPASDSSNPPF